MNHYFESRISHEPILVGLLLYTPWSTIGRWSSRRRKHEHLSAVRLINRIPWFLSKLLSEYHFNGWSTSIYSVSPTRSDKGFSDLGSSKTAPWLLLCLPVVKYLTERDLGAHKSTPHLETQICLLKVTYVPQQCSQPTFSALRRRNSSCLVVETQEKTLRASGVSSCPGRQMHWEWLATKYTEGWDKQRFQHTVSYLIFALVYCFGFIVIICNLHGNRIVCQTRHHPSA